MITIENDKCEFYNEPETIEHAFISCERAHMFEEIYQHGYITHSIITSD